MIRRIILSCLLVTPMLGYISAASATVTCTIQGYMYYEPIDFYYCDTDYMSSCSGWKEVDLDDKRSTLDTSAPLKYMRVSIRNSSSTEIGYTHTSSTGWFLKSVSLSGSSCTGQTVIVRQELKRVHESDISSSSPRYRLQVSETSTSSPYYKNTTLTLTGTTTQIEPTILASDTSSFAKATAVYYTANSAISEIVTWSTNLSTSFASTSSPQRIIWTSTRTDASLTEWTSGNIYLNKDDYRNGKAIRHELGHRTHRLIHNSLQTNGCLSYAYNGDSANSHSSTSCEYGFASTVEGIADFIAVRSITSTDTNVWLCNVTGTGSQAVCSYWIYNQTYDDDGDGIYNPAWYDVGDDFSNDSSDCAYLGSNCPCTGTACGSQSNKNSYGFRVEAQVARFFWDMIDTSDDDGEDDTDLSMAGFVTAAESMSCSGTGTNSCNQPNTTSCTSSGMDKYNAYDYGSVITGDQAAERSLNCVAYATN